MIFVSDQRGQRIHVSDEWKTLTGQDPEASYGDGWLMRVHQDDRSIVQGLYADAIKHTAEFSIRYRLLGADDTVRWIMAGGIPSFGPPDGRFIGFLGSLSELASDDPGVIGAYGSVGRFIPSPTHASVPLGDKLDQIADCLILAHTLIEGDGVKSALPSLRAAMFEVGKALAARTRDRRTVN